MNYYLDTEFHEYKKKPLIGKSVDTIELISIGITTEDDRDYYAISKDFDLKAAWENKWLRNNVLRQIWKELYIKQSIENSVPIYYETSYGILKNEYEIVEWSLKSLEKVIKKYGKSNEQIAKEVYHIINPEILTPNFSKSKGWTNDKNPTFYAYYGDYDWVVFCWLFGRMVDLPKGFPMYCRDLQQVKEDLIWTIQEVGETREQTLKWLESQEDYPKQVNEHNALADAKWNKELHKFLKEL